MKVKKNTDFHDKRIPTEGLYCCFVSNINRFWLLKMVKTFIHRCFYKNANTLSKKKVEKMY